MLILAKNWSRSCPCSAASCDAKFKGDGLMNPAEECVLLTAFSQV